MNNPKIRTAITDKNGKATHVNKNAPGYKPSIIGYNKPVMLQPAAIKASHQELATEGWSTRQREGDATVYRNANGEKHRLGGPAVDFGGGNVQRWENGVFVSASKPGLLNQNGEVVYRTDDGVLSNQQGPAIYKEGVRASFYLEGDPNELTKVQWEQDRHLTLAELLKKREAEKAEAEAKAAAVGLESVEIVDANGRVTHVNRKVEGAVEDETKFHSVKASTRSIENSLDIKPELFPQWDERGMNIRTGKPFDESGKTQSGIEVSEAAMNSWEDDDELVDGVDSLGFDWNTGRHELTEREKVALEIGPEALLIPVVVTHPEPNSDDFVDAVGDEMQRAHEDSASPEESKLRRDIIAAEASLELAASARVELDAIRENIVEGIGDGSLDGAAYQGILNETKSDITKLDRQIGDKQKKLDRLNAKSDHAEIDGRHAEQIVDVNGKLTTVHKKDEVDEYDHRGFHRATGVHEDTGNRFNSDGLDARGFTELGDNLFTDHGVLDTNGYDFHGFNPETGKHYRTGETWDENNRFANGDEVPLWVRAGFVRDSVTFPYEWREVDDRNRWVKTGEWELSRELSVSELDELFLAEAPSGADFFYRPQENSDFLARLHEARNLNTDQIDTLVNRAIEVVNSGNESDEGVKVLRSLSANENASSASLHQILNAAENVGSYDDSSYVIERNLALNPATDSEDLRRLSQPPYFKPNEVAANESTPPEIVRDIAKSYEKPYGLSHASDGEEFIKIVGLRQDNLPETRESIEAIRAITARLWSEL
jgi:hypothetical protein